MRSLLSRSAVLAITVIGWTASIDAADLEVLQPVTNRFAKQDVEETPSFQRHVVPLFGRLGCNGRACHGSFQGRGGFRLSLFGYDFDADHEALFEDDNPRVDRESPLESLIIAKPTSEDEHEGGLRYKKDGWEYQLIRRWIEEGAENGDVEQLLALEVEPKELVFKKGDSKAQLKVVAVWEDGTREDVTPLCRFHTNNSEFAKISENGLVTSGKPGDTHVVVSYDNAVVPIPVIRPVSDKAGKNYPSVPTPTKVDELVVQKLRKLGVVPSDECDDAEFLRRVRLDMTGTLPLPAEVEAFLADDSPNKREQKVDELLETPEYAAWWTTRLCDYTGNNATQLNNVTPIRGRAGSDWYQWIYKRVEENAPYDELVAGIVTAVSRRGDESYREYCERMSEVYQDETSGKFAELDQMPHYWARRDVRKPEERAIAFAYTFMGIRIQCAQCHKHPFDQWSKKDFEQFAKFFGNVQLANNGRDRKEYNKFLEELGLKGQRGGNLRRKFSERLQEGKAVPFPELYLKPAKGEARLLGDESIDLASVEDPRAPLMDWLRSPDNRFFARAFVNRVWANYFNVGIVNPPDDLSLANPPSNAPLLDYLAKGFVESGFDMKWLHRTIANSRTYQLSWKTNETNATDERNFSRMVPRRLPAEVAYDAIRQATLSDARVAELNDDMNGRAIKVASSGYRNNRGGAQTYALSIFGRSTRESNCDCDRSSTPSLLQTVYLQNDPELLRMIDDTREGWVAQVSMQYGLKSIPSAKRTGTPNRAFKRQIETLQKRVAQLKKSKAKNKEEQLKRAKQALARVQARMKANNKNNKKKDAPKIAAAKPLKQLGEFNPQEVATKAYLRTLSRPPRSEELERTVKYLNDSEDKAKGVRDVLWALINTKEFVVNH